MKTTDTYNTTIFCGLREGYDGPVHAHSEVERLCQRYVNEVGLCVTVKPTHFFYVRGNEPGVEVGIINYPRYPKEPEEILNHALAIARRLKAEFKQERVTIVTTDKTYMLEPGDELHS
jgi:hypothetical protein